MTCREPRVAGAVDDLFARGRVAGWRFRRMWRHLDECTTCRSYYDRVAIAWRALGREGEPPQIAEARADALLAGLRGADAREAQPGGRRLRFWGLGTLAAVGALVLLWMVIGRGTGGAGGTWVERGGEGARADRLRGVRAFCIARSASGTPTIRSAEVFTAESGGASPVLRCGLGDELQFAYTLGSGAPEFLLVEGLDAAGVVHRYVPAIGGAPIRLTGNVTDEPIEGSIRLGVNHGAGLVNLEAVFRSAPRTDVAGARCRLALQLEP